MQVDSEHVTSKAGTNKLKRMLQILFLLVVLAVAFVHFILPTLVERSMNQVDEHHRAVIRPEVQALHDSLFIVDLHADSLMWKRNLLKKSSVGHVDIPRLKQGNVALQVYSAVTKSPSGLNYTSNTASSDDITKLAILSFWPSRTWGSLFERARYQLQKLDNFAKRSEGALIVIRTAAEFAQFVQRRDAGEKTTAGLFLIEGAHPLEGSLENLDRLYAQGLRIAGLTHFFDNELGGSLHGVSRQGLSLFGKQVVQRANQLGVIIDVAHASPAMVADVLAHSTRPVLLSHGGLKGACDTPRNLDDTLMRSIAATGGILGVGFWDGAVCDNSPAGIVRSIRYAIDLMGLRHVALGSDFDGTVKTAIDVSELPALTQAMVDANFTEEEIRAVMGENVKQFLLNNLPQ